LNVLPVEQVDKRSRCQYGRLRREPGQVTVARNKHVGTTCDARRLMLDRGHESGG